MAANAGGIRAGRAYVEVGTDETSLEKGLKSAAAKVTAFGQAITGIGTAIVGAGAAFLAPFVTSAKVFADAGSALNDMSARTGLSVEELSALSHAATQTGTDIGAVEGGIRKMQKAMLAGSEENLQAAGTFAALGLDVKKLMQLSPDQQFETIARAIGQIPNPTARAGAAMQVFGKSGTALLPMIEDLGALTDEAKAFGLVWTGEEAKKADALGDSLDLLKETLGRVVTSIGSALAPMLTEVAASLANAARYVVEFAKANGPLIVTAFKIGLAVTAAGAAIVGLGVAISGVGAVLGVVASGIGAITSLFAALFSPIGLVVAGLAALAAWFLTSTETGSQAITFLSESFNSLKETAVQAFKGIADALKAGDIGLAGQILWAGLKVEFLKGINYLKSLWADWGTASIEVFRGVSFGIAKAFIDAWFNVQVGFVNALAIMKIEFTNFSSFLMKAWNSVGGFFAVVWEKIKGLFGDKDAEANIKRINDEASAANAEQEKKRTEAVAGINAGRAEQLAGIEENRGVAEQSIIDQKQAETDARRKAAQEGLAGDAAQLQAAQDELAGLVGQAGKEAEAADAAKPPPKKPKPGVPEFEPFAIEDAVAAAKAKFEVAGTFTAANLAGLGAGTSIQNDQLSEQKKQTKTLESLNHKADIGRLVFT